MSKLNLGRYKSSRTKKGTYRPSAAKAITRVYQAVLTHDPVAYLGFSNAQMEGMAERLDTYAIWFSEYPNRWFKGSLRSYEGQDTTYCVMGLDIYCTLDKLDIGKLVDYDQQVWNGIDNDNFQDACWALGLVAANDSEDIDLPTFSVILHRTAAALREHAYNRANGRNRSWEQTVKAAFWRQRKTLGLIKKEKVNK